MLDGGAASFKVERWPAANMLSPRPGLDRPVTATDPPGSFYSRMARAPAGRAPQRLAPERQPAAALVPAGRRQGAGAPGPAAPSEGLAIQARPDGPTCTPRLHVGQSRRCGPLMARGRVPQVYPARDGSPKRPTALDRHRCAGKWWEQGSCRDETQQQQQRACCHRAFHTRPIPACRRFIHEFGQHVRQEQLLREEVQQTRLAKDEKVPRLQLSRRGSVNWPLACRDVQR